MRNRFYASNCVGWDWNLEFFFSVPNREKSTGVTWTKLLASKSIVRRSSRKQVRPLGIDPLSAIFESESSASPSLRAICWKRYGERVKKCSEMLVFDCFSAQEVSQRVGTVRNRFYASNYVGCNWNFKRFFSVQTGEKLTWVTWTKFFGSKSKVRPSGKNQVSSLWIDSLSAIFESEKLRKSLAYSYLLKMLQKKSQKVVGNARFWPVSDCFSAQRASPRVKTVRNRFYASNYVRSDTQLEIFFLLQNREKSTGEQWSEISGSKSKVLRSGWNRASPLGNDPLSPIFWSKKLCESAGPLDRRKTRGRWTFAKRSKTVEFLTVSRLRKLRRASGPMGIDSTPPTM